MGVVGLHTHKLEHRHHGRFLRPILPFREEKRGQQARRCAKLRPRVLVRAGPYLIINQGHDITNGGFRQTKPLEELFCCCKTRSGPAVVAQCKVVGTLRLPLPRLS